MGWIDIALPLLPGLAMTALPGLFHKRTGEPEKDSAATAKMRGIGLLLLVVAALYALVKLAQSSSQV